MASYRKLASGLWNVQIRIKGHKALSASFETKRDAEVCRDLGVDLPSLSNAPPVSGGRLQIELSGGQGACLFSKRLEKGRFVWPATRDGKISVTPAQLSMLLEGIDWRMPGRTWRPLSTG